jgi:antitoxin component YwqK of YwqJK toxin-antitoxin module
MGRSTSVSYYNNNKIKKTVDSSVNIKSTTTYTYNNNDLTSLNIVTEDTFMKNSSAETHLWFYENSLPTRMLLIKNNIDTTVIQFVKDSLGNVAEEHWIKKGRRVETYLYFYNDKNLVTDIVRFNLKAGRLLPDFMFEYDDKGTITQFIQVPQASADYLIWRYIYNPNGLKQQEQCFTKTKQPVGRIEYSYR